MTTKLCQSYVKRGTCGALAEPGIAHCAAPRSAYSKGPWTYGESTTDGLRRRFLCWQHGKADHARLSLTFCLFLEFAGAAGGDGDGVS